MSINKIYDMNEILEMDAILTSKIYTHSNKYEKGIMLIFTQTGNILLYLFLLVFIPQLLYPLVRIVIAYIPTIFLLKFFVKRKRPYKVFDFIEKGDVLCLSDDYSFPSGHCFFISMLSMYVFPSSIVLTILISCIMGYSRIILGMHYVLDVLVGSLLGIIFGCMIF